MSTDQPPAAAHPDIDPELEAIAAVAAALRPLSDQEKRRVVEWAAKRYGVEVAAPSTGKRVDRVTGRDGDEYEHFAELFDRAQPKTDAQKALVASYWVQAIEGKTQFSSVDVNVLLKDLGHQLSHIAVAMSSLQARKPSLVLQLKKSGSSRQARKTYKLSTAGIAAVQSSIQAGGFTEE